MSGMHLTNLGAIINTIVAMTITVAGIGPAWLGVVAMLFAAHGWLGVMLLHAGHKRLGAKVVMACSMAFPPVGLLGFFGALRAAKGRR